MTLKHVLKGIALIEVGVLMIIYIGETGDEFTAIVSAFIVIFILFPLADVLARFVNAVDVRCSDDAR